MHQNDKILIFLLQRAINCNKIRFIFVDLYDANNKNNQKQNKTMRNFVILLCAVLAISCCGSADKSANVEAAPAPATAVIYGDTIVLTQPDLAAGKTINEALAERASSREYSTEPLSLEELSGVMWAAAGVNRSNGHLTAPSALALYPVSVYAFTAEGVFRYNSELHVLVREVEGDHRELSAAQDFAYTAPLNLVYVADLSKFDGRGIDRTKAEFLAGQDAAGYAENVNLYAAGNGLKAITRGSLKSAEVLSLLSLDPKQYAIVLAQTVGK